MARTRSRAVGAGRVRATRERNVNTLRRRGRGGRARLCGGTREIRRCRATVLHRNVFDAVVFTVSTDRQRSPRVSRIFCRFYTSHSYYFIQLSCSSFCSSRVRAIFTGERKKKKNRIKYVPACTYILLPRFPRSDRLCATVNACDRWITCPRKT